MIDLGINNTQSCLHYVYARHFHWCFGLFGYKFIEEIYDSVRLEDFFI